ncbi:MAG TPA: MoxR family ATPase [Candidatus Competibacter sp.]|nr:MoxR family ATPase [Candidatus Competibacter sp.]
MKLLDIKAGATVRLPARGDLPEQTHVFDLDSIRAVNAALAARRPLLVRGEPGIGKSQLAKAAAKQLRRPYVQCVVDARTESRDLLWHYDAVTRLAEAQLCGALRQREEDVRSRLAVDNFLHPGPLWWAFDWQSAVNQAAKVGVGAPAIMDEADPTNGCVVLIDEIDKAESDVPNGLLEALGNGEFTPLGRHQSVSAAGQPPLVIVTTNGERALPDAFIRRCLVLHLKLPTDRKGLESFLNQRGRAHFPDADRRVIEKAVKLLADQRAPEDGVGLKAGLLPLPGQAEFLDLLRAVIAMCPKQPDDQLRALGEIAQFALQKQPDDAG